jgi:hypothetical protein
MRVCPIVGQLTLDAVLAVLPDLAAYESACAKH